MKEIVRVLMRRDKLTRQEAEERLKEMREDVRNGEDPEEVLYNEGLEPDYIHEVI